MRRLLAKADGRPLRFLIAGGINTAVGLAFYPLLLWAVPYFRTHYMAALGIAQVACLCFAFAVHKLGVFRTRGNLVGEFVRFASFYLLSYALNWLALPLMVEAGGIPPVVAQTAFTVLVVFGSYFWHSRLTFRVGAG